MARITAAAIAEWYATRNRLGGSDILSGDAQRLLAHAHHHHHGIVGGGRLTVREVREYVEWARKFGSEVERQAVAS